MNQSAFLGGEMSGDNARHRIPYWKKRSRCPFSTLITSYTMPVNGYKNIALILA